jgi:hypothetical protein
MATGNARETLLARLAALRQHQRDGRRSPHKPLLVLLALGRLASTGASMLSWMEAETTLADLIAEFGPASKRAGRRARRTRSPGCAPTASGSSTATSRWTTSDR